MHLSTTLPEQVHQYLSNFDMYSKKTTEGQMWTGT